VPFGERVGVWGANIYFSLKFILGLPYILVSLRS
jgi:hypothetical protein